MKELNLDRISVLKHSAIRIEGSLVVYFDPFHLEEETHDADLIFITHDHFDHFSADDVRKVLKEDTLLICPLTSREAIVKAGVIREERIVCMEPGDSAVLKGAQAVAVAAYNIGKKFHPKENRWLGYIVTLDGVSYYVAGDTDATLELLSVKADVALLPVGGTYTMTAEEAALAAKEMDVETFIPTHYGSIVGEKTDGERFRKLVGDAKKVLLKL